MNINEIATQTGFSEYTLRYYEKIGLLCSIKRDQSGRRLYSKKDLDLLIFIKDLKLLGLSINDMLSFGQEDCVINSDLSDICIESILIRRNVILKKHLEELDHQINELQQERGQILKCIDKYQNFLNG
ncbi:MerR family transcriptional regulator [Oenococcus alcoholitolerans]|uniref:HTH merR-type domain-containing protein n=1 Tax=Oenococcus alcoholitolerans TaxID=931074 RepID=A0ABR4XNG0_9LACO|nr:hypothetical protein Q757_10255 [Oenococcus alcoholitolerans]